MELLSIGKFAKIVGVTTTTLRQMHKTGELIPVRISQGGTRYYSIEQVNQLIGKQNKQKKVVGYCRVSTKSQKNDLENQINNVRTYMCAKGYQFDIISDIGSGINYNKKGLQELISKINNQEIDKVVVLYKDRLIGFGFEMLQYFCTINDIEIEIIDNKEVSEEQELADDLIQITTIFANRLYGSRSKKTKELIEEVKNNVNN